MKRSLTLRRESLTQLTDTDLADVAGGCIPAISCQILKCWLTAIALTESCPSRTGC